jgi:hypothetical protein
MVKITKSGSFGKWPVADGAHWKLTSEDATAGRYVERIIDSNETLQDDIVLHGVYVDAQGRAQIVTSQPYYDGDLPRDRGAMRRDLPSMAREQEQRIFVQQEMKKQGFIAVDDRTYYRESDNTAIFDAHLNNVMWVRANGRDILVPFDVTVMHPDGALRTNLESAAKSAPPIANPLDLLPGTGRTSSSRSGTGTNATTPGTGAETETGTAGRRRDPWR